MKVILNNTDVVAAIIAHVKAEGINTDGKSVSVDITVGRKGTGCTATVDIVAAEAVATSCDGCATDNEQMELPLESMEPTTERIEEGTDTAEPVSLFGGDSAEAG